MGLKSFISKLLDRTHGGMTAYAYAFTDGSVEYASAGNGRVAIALEVAISFFKAVLITLRTEPSKEKLDAYRTMVYIESMKNPHDFTIPVAAYREVFAEEIGKVQATEDPDLRMFR